MKVRITGWMMPCLVTFFAACHTGDAPSTQTGTQPDSARVVKRDEVPATRTTVAKKAVASYYTTVGDPKLDRKFGISIYETGSTFQYLLKMQYEAMQATDTLTVPDLGAWPKVEIRPGKTKLSCIIGFLDQKGDFKEYKMLKAEGNDMRLVVLKRYGVGKYSTPY